MSYVATRLAQAVRGMQHPHPKLQALYLRAARQLAANIIEGKAS